MIGLTLFEEGAVAAAVVIAGIAAWRGIKVIVVHRRNGDHDDR